MGEEIRQRFAAGIGRAAAFLPELVAAIVIFGLGYVVARVLGGLTMRLLARTRLDEAALRRMGRRGATLGRSPSALLGSVVFWLTMLLATSLAAEQLGIAALSAGINRILAYTPHVLIAAAVVAIGVIVADLAAGLIGTAAPRWVSRAARVAIIALAAFMALDQLGVAPTIVMTTFIAVLGAAAVAAAIAFGIGGIPIAREHARRWSERAQRRIATPSSVVDETTTPTAATTLPGQGPLPH
jgi:hypothetical protein